MAISPGVLLILQGIGTAGAICMSTLSFIALATQIRKIQISGSAKSLSEKFFISLSGSLVAGGAYAFAHGHRLMIVANALRFPLAVLLCLMVGKYHRRLRHTVGIFAVTTAACLTGFFIPDWSENISLLISALSISTAFVQTLRIIRAKTAGELSIVLTLSQFLSATFWMLYLLQGSVAMIVICLCNVTVAGITLDAAWRYRIDRTTLFFPEVGRALLTIVCSKTNRQP